MSSGVDSGGIIAAAVMLPVGVAFGAGWLAWKSGMLLVEANRAADNQIAEKKRQLEEADIHRKCSALAAHSQLINMCTQILSQIDENNVIARAIDLEEIEKLRAALHDICNESIPDDAMRIESLNSIGFSKLESIVAKQNHLLSLRMEDDKNYLYRGLSLADLMADMRVTIDVMKVQATEGKDIQAVDPIVLERIKLNEKLTSVTKRTMEALERIAELSSSYGLSASSSAWFHSCFNGVDEQIELLHMPSTSIEQLKKGIKRIEGLLEQYDMFMPNIESDQKKLVALYQVYVNVSKALGESIASIKSFKNLKALEERIKQLEERSKKAEECAKIFQQLGPTAYICYAWDQELRALGYSVHTRTDIEKMTNYKPQHARLGGSKLPYYYWNNDDLTQLYSITSECSLQVIVHGDGSVTMQTISGEDDNEAKLTQKNHCTVLNRLHENLRKNWFVIYDYQETASSDEITSVAEWFSSEENSWKRDKKDHITKRRKKTEGESREKLAR